jgi:hypothetical protein
MGSKDTLPSGAASAQTPLLPLWATVKTAYSVAWGYRMEYLKIIWCWLLVAIPIVCLYEWFVWPSTEVVLCKDFAHPPDQALMDATNRAFIDSLQETLFYIFFVASFAVEWHRRWIRRHEKTTSTYYLRLDSVVWNYSAFGVCLFLLSAPCFVLINVMINNPHSSLIKWTIEATFVVTVVLTLVVAVVLCTRFSIILPTRALELKDVTLKAVWQKTSRNLWRLFWGGLLCGVPGILLASIIPRGCGSNIAGPITYGMSMILIIVIVVPLELAFLSLSYRHFFGRRDTA